MFVHTHNKTARPTCFQLAQQHLRGCWRQRVQQQTLQRAGVLRRHDQQRAAQRTCAHQPGAELNARMMNRWMHHRISVRQATRMSML